MKSKTHFALSALAVIALAGCATHVSRSISDDGVPAQVVFPETDRIVLKEGTYPTPEALRQVGAGMTKDQLYDLLGRPHFREGFAAREWDYLFHFRQNGKVHTCQYKVTFDSDYRGRGFYWSPAECEALIEAPSVALDPVAAPARPPAAVANAAPVINRFQVSGDALFAFGRHDMDGISSEGRRQLQRIAAQLGEIGEVQKIEVVGHSDRIGSREGNLVLSGRRADTVRSFFIAQGVPADKISARGAGMESPVVTCEEQPREALIRCLQPNRRVEITASSLS